MHIVEQEMGKILRQLRQSEQQERNTAIDSYLTMCTCVCRFKWDVKKFAHDYSISPAEGYISPGMEVPFEVTFHPKEINNDIRYEVTTHSHMFVNCH